MNLEDFFIVIKNSILDFTFKDAIDILLVAALIYALLRFTSKTRANQVLKGLGVFVLVSQICSLIGLTAMTWLLEYIVSAGAVLLIVLFQPEIRRAFERMGRGKIFDIRIIEESAATERAIEDLARAITSMSIRKTGAIIVFERRTGLKDVIESGITLEAKISSELIENIFVPGSPLHDGAMIIKDERIVAAGCFLPLSDNKQISSELGTRHRAAMGISEVSDSITIVVSEETGVISKVADGKMTRYLDRKKLTEELSRIFADRGGAVHSISKKLKKKGAAK